MSGRFIKPMQFSLTEYDCVSSSDDEDACPPSDDDIQALAFGVFHSHVITILCFPIFIILSFLPI